MSKHTPGPWEIWQYDESSSRPGIEAGDCSIVVFGDGKADEMGIWGRDDDEAIANARLISAAPDLLEASIHALKALRSNPDSPMTASECLLSLAIAKALGETDED